MSSGKSTREAPDSFYDQTGVIAYRPADDGPEVLLITSRRSGRWVIPKGVIDPGETPQQAAEREAMEEAGIAGKLRKEHVGRYEYEKWGDTCRVTVYLMRVARVLDEWPEQDFRERRWCSPKEAAGAVREPELSRLLKSVAKRI